MIRRFTLMLVRYLLILTMLGASESRSEDVLPWVEGSTTIAVLPDTQVYSMKHPDLFMAQTK